MDARKYSFYDFKNKHYPNNHHVILYHFINSEMNLLLRVTQLFNIYVCINNERNYNFTKSSSSKDDWLNVCSAAYVLTVNEWKYWRSKDTFICVQSTNVQHLDGQITLN